jgi:Protein of unknown function (DUF1571)
MIRKFFLGILLLAPLGFYPLLHSEPTGDDNPNPPSPQEALTTDHQLAIACFAILPSQSFPGGIPWEPMRNLAEHGTPHLTHLAEKDLVAFIKRVLEEKDDKDSIVFLERTLAERDPVAFLERALARVDREVHSYRCIFDKQERVKGKMRPRESILIHFRNEPFSVHMEWLEGQDRAFRTLYVKSENPRLLTVRVGSAKFGFNMHKKVDAPDVLATSRFPITQFGMHSGALDTLVHMQSAQKKGTLHVRYAGKESPKEVGGRLCYKFVRTPYEPPEELEQLNELITYIDAATMMQVGSVLRDTEGKLIAEYFFRNIEINPPFDEKQFTEDSL